MIARLVRIVPVLALLAVGAAIVYLAVSWRSSPNRGKEVLIKLFTVVTGVISGFFGLASLYALSEGNEPVLDLAFSFFLVGFVGLCVTRVCRAVFLRNHPAWRKRPTQTTRPGGRPQWPPWRR